MTIKIVKLFPLFNFSSQSYHGIGWKPNTYITEKTLYINRKDRFDECAIDIDNYFHVLQ